MGTEFVNNEARVGASSNSSNYSTSGDNKITAKKIKKINVN